MTATPTVGQSSQLTKTKDNAIHSILAADFGSVNTRVTLFDLVDGQFRLVSRAQMLTTAQPPVGDVGIGLQRALEQMGTLIGRQLVADGRVILGEHSDGSGTDLFIATASGGRPMKTVLVGLMPDISLVSGARTLGTTYVELCDTLSLADIRSTEDQVNAILRHQPDLIFIVGGTNYGASAPILGLLQTVKLAVLLATGQKPVVLYAGNEALGSTVKALIGDETQVFVAGNVRPNLIDEKRGPAELELALVYGAYKSASVGGFEDIQKASPLGVVPTAQSYNNVMRYLGELSGQNQGVMCIDVGSSTVTVCTTVRKQPYISIRSDLGLGHSAVSSVQAIGTTNIARWLTFEVGPDDILDYAWNKALHPSTVPQTSRELELEYAIARELIRKVVAESRTAWRGVPPSELLPPMQQIIGAGSVLAEAINPGLGALLMLDALQPVGVTRLKLDPYGVIAALGAAAYAEPLATVQALETGGLLDLGTAIIPSGHASGGNAMDVTIKFASGRTIKRSIPGGTIKIMNVPAGQKADVTISLGRGLRVNGRSRLSMSVEGGAAGLILDGRGRPIILPKDIAKRAELLPKWYTAAQSSED